jgi:hypothetical protein
VDEVLVFIEREPDEEGFSDDVIFRNKTPVAGVQGVVAVIAHHEVVILFEGILGHFFSIDEEFAVFNFSVVIVVIQSYSGTVQGEC